MAEPIELKIGQVWESDGWKYEVIALGPEYVCMRLGGHWTVAEPQVWTLEYFRKWRPSLRLLRPKHELWVNVYRNKRDGQVAFGCLHESRVVAERLRRVTDHVLACLKIEFEEGEGL